jgi:curved DNA-binding protein
MEYKDYYKTLGVPKAASQAEIKKAFRKLAQKFHPDRNPGDANAEKRFKDVNEANAVLGDPAKRKKYDTLGADWEAYQRAGAQGGDPFAPGGPFAGFRWAGGDGTSASGRSGNVRYEFHTMGGDSSEFSDFFRTIFGSGGADMRGGTARGRTATEPSLDEILAGMGLGVDPRAGAQPRGRTATASRGAQPRPTVEATAEVSLEEAFHGTTRVVDVDGKRLEVTIPKGVDSGRRIRLTGRGPGGSDLVVVVRVTPNSVFTRRGADLERELPLRLEEALLGAEVPVATLKGRVLLKIPAGTQTGRTFRLTGQGMPRFREDGFGDLFVKTKVIIPTDLSDDATAAARRFLDLANQTDPRQSTTRKN